MKKWLLIFAALFPIFSDARVTAPSSSDADTFCSGPAAAEICFDKNGALVPTTTLSQTLGTSGLRWNNIFGLGTNLTGVSVVAGNITSGPLASSILPSTVAYTSVANTFTELQTVNRAAGGAVISGTSNSGTNQIGLYASGSTLLLQTETNDNLGFATGNGVSRMRLNTAGNLILDYGVNAATATITDDLTVTGDIFKTMVATVTVLSGDIISVAGACGGILRLTATTNVSTALGDTFTAPAAANAGCIIMIVNSGGSGVITLDDNSNFDTGLGYPSSGAIMLGTSDSIIIGSLGTRWLSFGTVSDN